MVVVKYVSMQNKSTSIILGVIIVILIIIGVAFATKNKAPAGVVEPTDTAVPAGVTTTPSIMYPTGTSTATTTATTTSSIPKSYTLAEIAAHNTSSNCWTAINFKVYDLTPFVTKHPGGVQNITKLCGIDGTAKFTAQHGSTPGAIAQLAKLQIGVLANY
jgi:hypothetical protein